VPGFIRWNAERQRHILSFEPPVELKQTGNPQDDIVANTLLFNQILERFVRRFPDQWLWIHKRWKTRPEGQPSLY
jgi:KDO2-lipid IV(A) lauroyltransferase